MGTRGARTNNLCNAKKRKLSTTFQQIEFHKCSANSRNLSRTVEQNTELKKKTNNFVDIISVFGLFFFCQNTECIIHYSQCYMLLYFCVAFKRSSQQWEKLKWLKSFGQIDFQTFHEHNTHTSYTIATLRRGVRVLLRSTSTVFCWTNVQQRNNNVKKKTRNRYQKHLQKIAATIMRTSVLFVCLYIGLCFLFFVRVPVSRTLLFMLNWAGLSMCVYAPHWNGVPQKLQLISPPLLHNDNQSAR